MAPETLLKKWIDKQGISLAHFGGLIGTTRAAVSYYAKGQRCPKPHIADEIERVTNGWVPALVWKDQRFRSPKGTRRRQVAA